LITWLASYPRSGNTFFRILVNQLYGIRIYSIYKDAIINSDPEVREIVGSSDTPVDPQETAASLSPYLVKTHEMASDEHPAILIVRDGRDVMVSYARYIMSFVPDGDRQRSTGEFQGILRMLITSADHFGGWSHNVMSWLSRRAPTALVKYEDLLQRPLEIVPESLEKVGFPIGERQQQSQRSFDELHEKMPDFFRKGKVGAWRTEMPEELQELFWQTHANTMRRLGYTHLIVDP
jgi:hypothetical protein